MAKRWRWLIPVVLILSGLASIFVQPVAARSPTAGGGIFDIYSDSYLNDLSPDLVYNPVDHEYLAVWYASAGGNTTLWAQRISPSGALIGDEFPLLFLGGDGTDLSVAYDPVSDHYLVSYTRSIGGAQDVTGLLITPDYTVSTPEIEIDTQVNRQIHPSVIADSTSPGGGFVVVYQYERMSGIQEYYVMARRVSPQAQVSNPITVTPVTIDSYVNPQIAYNAARQEYLVVYAQEFVTGDSLYAQRLSGALALIGSPLEVAAESEVMHAEPAVVGGPDEYLVVWQQLSDVTGQDIYARRISGTGTAASAFKLNVGDSSDQDHQTKADVAYRPGYGYWVIWQKQVGTNIADLYARQVRVGHDAPEGEELVIDDHYYDQKDAVVACEPSWDCLMAWADSWPVGGNYEIRGMFKRIPRLYIPLVVKRN